MVRQVGGSISFSPPDDHSKAQWQGYDTRHMLAELDPKPDQVTVCIGSTQWDLTSMITMDDVAGTHIANEEAMWAFSKMVADATPDFYIEHLKRLHKRGIQPYFALAHVHSLDKFVERLIRRGLDGACERFLQHGRRWPLRLQSLRLDGADTPDAAWLGVHVSVSVSVDPSTGCPALSHSGSTPAPASRRISGPRARVSG